MIIPNYYFNGYAAYKNFYLISPEINFSRFMEIVDGILWERANPSKPEWLVDIWKFITNKFGNNMSVFFSPNILGDEMEFVKTVGKVNIYYCPDYEYVDVIGLSKAEKELAESFQLKECEDGSWLSYIRDGKIGEIK